MAATVMKTRTHRKQPSYRLHKRSGQAVVTLDKDIYLGKFGSPESRQKYDRIIAEWLLRGRQGPSASNPATATVRQIIAGYLQHASTYYGGEIPPEIVTAVRELNHQYGDTLAAEFGTLAFKSLRERLITMPVKAGRRKIERTLTRRYINVLMARVVQIFKWAASNEMVPASVYHTIRAVEPLRRGRCAARESGPVKPVREQDLQAVLDIAPPYVAAMIRLMLYTGARASEIFRMRTCDIDTRRATWKYTPTKHKTQYTGKTRVIFIGPKAKEVLQPLLKADLQAYIFTPADAFLERRARLRGSVKPTTMRCLKPYRGTRCASVRRPRYTTHTFWAALTRLCDRADRLAHERHPEIPADVRIVPRWHAHQLRHNAATLIRQEFGIEVARAVLGHSSAAITEIYAEQDMDKAEKAIAQVG